MEPPSPPSRPGRAPSVALVVTLLLVGVVAVGGVWWSSRPDPGDGAAAVTSNAPVAPQRSEVRLEAAGPHEARVLVDGQALGVIARAADGTIHGEALGRLAFQTRRLVRREVEVVRAPDVDVELALAVQRLLAAGNVRAALVER